MKIGLISGHGAGDSGALGCGYMEADLTIEVVRMLDAKLKSIGVDTKVYPYDRNAYKDCKNGGLVVDFSDCNYVLEVHFNACVNDEEGNGITTGTEIWVTPREEGVSAEKAILREMESLGFTNRGVKVEDFLVINKVKDQGVSSALIETCFIDDKDDMDLFDKDRGAVADAVIKGICESFGYEPQETEHKEEPEEMPSEEKVLYRVQVGAYSARENADNQLEVVKAKGFDAFITQVEGLYKVQVGAYSVKANAEAQLAKVKAAGFDAFITTKAGTAASTPVVESLNVGDKVRLQKDAPCYDESTGFASWVYDSALYVREIKGSRIVISTLKSGAITGAVDKKYLTKI